MTTGQVDVKHIAKLPSVKSWRSTALAKRLVFKLFNQLRHGELVIQDGDTTHRFGGGDVSIAPSATVVIHEQRAYSRILTGGTMGAAEAYIDGDWSTEQLTDVTRVFSANIPILEAMKHKQNWFIKAGVKLAHAARKNSVSGSRENIAAHYDLGNEFFSLFLDPSLMYSSAVYPKGSDNLAEASQHKLKLICEDLELKPTDHLVEIGTGWGGMAIYAAENYGCNVTTTTISKEQLDYARAEVERRGLQDKVTLLFEDYRNLSGQFDKLVSIEMIEAVGHEYFDTYFGRVSSLLKPDGKAVIQAITINEQRYEDYRKSVDFIKRYIFPGGCLPSLNIISGALTRTTDMQIIDLRDIAIDYAKTLKHWHEAFMAELDAVKSLGFDEKFIRMWRFYLSYCEGGFRERIIGTYQITMAKPYYRPL
ncbi:MAG: class I SAM-dependent methyltransferase [Luminiphilus sp.]|jgi:cyclopropane-fatty-acyl-phospholipid synthase|nr:class I SAM-dependent methyltransferase [Pseudomonadales bacterium]MBL6900808.1 class I SAM-dependent methyltransferase [Luminiphilus sp.]